MHPPERVQSLFADLQRRGGNVLLLHRGGGGIACARLCGDDRRQLRVSTDGHEWQATVDAARDPARLGVVELVGTEPRSAATISASTPDDLPPPPEPVEPTTGDAGTAGWYSRVRTDDGLPALARHVDAHLSRLGQGEGDVRVCVDALDPLLDGYGPTELARFCAVVAGRVRTESALAHYHLAATAADAVEGWTPAVFDAVVETRRRDGEPQARWRFFRPAAETEWHRLDADH